MNLLAFGLSLLLTLPSQELYLEVGDRIEIRSQTNPTYCIVRTVDAGGGIHLPGLGRVLAEARTLDELAGVLHAATQYEEFFSLRVLPPLNKPISFRGAVRQAGQVPLSKGLRLSQVLKLAMPTEAAELAEVEIVAYDGSSTYVDVTSKEDPELRPGDTVVVPISTRPNTALILGGVGRPGTVDLKTGMTLRQAIGEVGGTTNHADLANVKLVRTGEADRILNLESSGDLRLQRGDTIQVPLVRDIAYITMVGNLLRPGLVAFRPGMRLSEAIKQAGGVGPNAGVDRILIRRAGGGGTQTRADLRPILERQALDPELKPGDLIEVPFGGIRPKPEQPTKGGFPIPP